MDNRTCLNMLETMCGGGINLDRSLVGYKKIDTKSLLNEWLDSDFYDLESEVKYMQRMLKERKIAFDSFALNTILNIELITNNPIAMKSLYNFLENEKLVFSKYLKSDGIVISDIHRGMNRNWNKLREKDKSVNIPGASAMQNILEAANFRFHINFETIEFIAINLKEDKMLVGLSPEQMICEIYKVENDDLRYIETLENADMNEISLSIDYKNARDIIDIREMDMMFI